MPEQCIKLALLDADAEAVLLKKWPEPQIMIRKPQGSAHGGAKGSKAAAAPNGKADWKPKKEKKKKKVKGKKKGKKGRRRN